MRIFIVDDEPLAVERLQMLLSRVPDVTLVGTAMDGMQALRMLDEIDADAVLLDVEMPGMDGIALARALGGALRPKIIFVTAFDRFAVTAFEVEATDYLVKPVEPLRLERAIDRARQSLVNADEDTVPSANAYVREFWVPSRSEMIRVPVTDIDLIEAERDYMRLHVGARSYLLHETVAALEEKLDPGQFIRVHRSAILRADTIVRMQRSGYGYWLCILADGREIRVGRKYLNRVRALTGRSQPA